MNPYERTASEIKRQSETPKRMLKTGAAIGTALSSASFASILARAAPFLSNYIPQDLAIRGLTKISPKFGTFINQSMEKGFNFDDVKDFIGEKVNESQEAKKSGNIIEQYSPELFQFMQDAIAKGEKPLRAAAAARRKFDKAIKSIEKDHKTTWDEIVSFVFGQEAKGMGESGLKRLLSPAETPREQQAAQQAASQLMGRGQPQTMQQQQQQGGIDPQLAQLLQQGNQILQSLQGRQ